jgi:hypothetical protein
MTYRMALESEQEQRYEQSVVTQQARECHTQGKRPISFGQGQLCKCGLKTAEDCSGCPS